MTKKKHLTNEVQITYGLRNSYGFMVCMLDIVGTVASVDVVDMRASQ